MATSLTNANDLISRFLSWWMAELSGMWRPLRTMMRSGPKTLTLDTSEQQWALRLKKGARLQELGRLDSQLPAAAVRKTVGILLSKAKHRNAELTILLRDSRSLRRPLEMPAIAEPNLRQALFFEIERQTPFRAEDVYFDYHVLVRQPESKRLTVEMIAAPRSEVDAILGQARDWGLQPSIVDVVARNSQSGIGINLLKSDAVSARWSSSRVASALIAIFLVAAVLYVPVNQLSVEDDSLAALVTVESAQAKLVLAKRAELEETIRAAKFLHERKRNSARELAVLNELTKALPDNTWLSRLSQNKDEVKISGYSAAASELIPRIDAVPLFKNPTFASPIVQDAERKLERFDISFELKGGRL
jgi:general secretion pathway protein L